MFCCGWSVCQPCWAAREDNRTRNIENCGCLWLKAAEAEGVLEDEDEPEDWSG